MFEFAVRLCLRNIFPVTFPPRTRLPFRVSFRQGYTSRGNFARLFVHTYSKETQVPRGKSTIKSSFSPITANIVEKKAPLQRVIWKA